MLAWAAAPDWCTISRQAFSPFSLATGTIHSPPMAGARPVARGSGPARARCTGMAMRFFT